MGLFVDGAKPLFEEVARGFGFTQVSAATGKWAMEYVHFSFSDAIFLRLPGSMVPLNPGSCELARFDRIREEIGWLKLVFGVLVAIDVSLIAWLGRNYADAEGGLVASGLLATIAVTAGIVWVSREAHKRFAEMEEL